MDNTNLKKDAPPPAQKSQLIALFNSGNFAEVETQVRLLIQESPESGFAWSLLGGALHMQGKDALFAIQKTAELTPDDAAAHNNLGNALVDQGLMQDAIASYRRALSINPNLLEVHCNLGNLLKDEGQFQDAVASYRCALEIKPDYADAHGFLGGALRLQGKLSEALACFQQQLKLSPDNNVARHHVASLSGENTERAPRQYVEGVFDNYAENFDTHLQNGLKYDIPSKLVAFVARRVELPSRQWTVLDLGCGTGLSGLAFAPSSRQLVGVDLSSKMLEKAAARGIYQRLEHSDLLTMMQAEQPSSYDAIIATDVFIYVGKLDEIMAAAKQLLVPGGMVAFSIETNDTFVDGAGSSAANSEYQLQKSGRYSHNPQYIARLASLNGFNTVEMEDVQIRLDAEKPIVGKMVLLRRP